MKTVYLFICLLVFKTAFAQDIAGKLFNAMNKLEKDSQFSHSILSIFIVDTKTGKPLFERNSQLGLAPASCQKIVTSTSAFELLGKDYRYQTQFGYDGDIADSSLNGALYISGNGDPTLGSWRWSETNEDRITNRILNELKKLNIRSAKHFVIDDTKWGTQSIPNGWVWEDIGNYYGAGCSAFNWHENQYDIILKPGKKLGEPVEVLSSPPLYIVRMVNELVTAAKGSGDHAYVYHAPYSMISFIRGTIPLGVDSFRVLASTPDGVNLFENKMLLAMHKAGVFVPQTKTSLTNYLRDDKFEGKMDKTICIFHSPTFDSINYWFLKKSVNLYGEAFVKTIGYEKTGMGSTDSGIAVIRDFWSKRGIERSALKIIDGSGLSPANRITTSALVKVLQYAKQQSWFPSFYNALPEMNGIKMKDGYIGGVRSYTGYIKSKTGIEYSFAFIVNNFDGNPGTAREKMWRVLDLLK
jgi:D-alanyl-D-alanine carboxypeptidase/D-alanyl-D-alanine-endopeptidase (penicillin-binding protein 4)